MEHWSILEWFWNGFMASCFLVLCYLIIAAYLDYKRRSRQWTEEKEEYDRKRRFRKLDL